MKKKTQIQTIWMVTREYGDIAGAGGVKDVVAQLSAALAVYRGRKIRVVLPLYGFIDIEALGLNLLPDPEEGNRPLQFAVSMHYALLERSESVRVYTCKQAGVTLYFIESPRFSEKGDVYTYTAEEQQRESWKVHGEGHFDYFAMNVLLQKAALQLMLYLDERPDVIHCHDGHAALIPALVRESDWLRAAFRGCGFLTTIHNAGRGYHQEVDDLDFARAVTGLHPSVISDNCLEGRFDPLLVAAGTGLVNTVSENYARELRDTGEDERTGWLGHTLFARGCLLEGVTNGIDPAQFDPRKGPEFGLPAPFDPRDDDAMDGKAICKQELVEQLCRREIPGGLAQYGFLDAVERPLFTFIGRFTGQKGVDILADTVRNLVVQRCEYNFVILGGGAGYLEERVRATAEMSEAAGRVCFLNGYSSQLAGMVYAAGDFFLLPSHFEPCGLSDFIAQLFANLPIVHSVGGLVKVVDGVTGFSYFHNDAENLFQIIDRAAECWHDKKLIREMQREAVALIEQRFTWKIVKDNYMNLYRRAKDLRITKENLTP